MTQPAQASAPMMVTYFFATNRQARRVAQILSATPTKIAFPVQNCIETDAPRGLVNAARERAVGEARAADAVRAFDALRRGELEHNEEAPAETALEEQSCTEHLGSATVLLECAELLTKQEQREEVLVEFKHRIRLALAALAAGRFTPHSRRTV